MFEFWLFFVLFKSFFLLIFQACYILCGIRYAEKVCGCVNLEDRDFANFLKMEKDLTFCNISRKFSFIDLERIIYETIKNIITELNTSGDYHLLFINLCCADPCFAMQYVEGETKDRTT